MDKIICTQDVEGERPWLESQFPKHCNLQTEFSALWPDQRLAPGNNNFLWEIPPDSKIDLDSIEFEKNFSLYQFNPEYVDHRWCQTEQLVSNLEFGVGEKSDLAQVITFGRCGTVYLEKLLYEHLGYQKLDEHTAMSLPRENPVVHMIENSRADVFMLYRKDWWEWAVSHFIARSQHTVNEHGQPRWPHSADNIDWTQVSPIEIDPAQLQNLHDYVLSNWNGYCHLRSKFRDLNFYVLEFSELIQVQRKNLDTKLSYKKSNLIKNYSEIKNMFEQQYLSRFVRYQTNALAHLQSMKCRMSIDSLLV
jgi:hypothetical protein